MIKTRCQGCTSFMCGNFYHLVDIYRNGDLIDTQKVFCCEDKEEASYWAVHISKKLTKEEKENYIF